MLFDKICISWFNYLGSNDPEEPVHSGQVLPVLCSCSLKLFISACLVCGSSGLKTVTMTLPHPTLLQSECHVPSSEPAVYLHLGIKGALICGLLSVLELGALLQDPGADCWSGGLAAHLALLVSLQPVQLASSFCGDSAVPLPWRRAPCSGGAVPISLRTKLEFACWPVSWGRSAA